jgi:glycosyltransferase involved in cell wall biosynthesis
MSKTLRVLYAAGPGNVIGTYRHWVENRDDPSQVSITYSSQFYEVCRALDAQAYVISSSKEKHFLRDGQFIFEHRPIPFRFSSGLLYHFGQLWYGLRLIISALWFRSDAVVIVDGTTHWFVLSLLAAMGVRVIPSLHCVFWPKYAVPSTVEKWLFNFSRHLFTHQCTAILTASDEISEQLIGLTGTQHLPLVLFLPTYRRTEFAEVSEPDENRTPFRVLFAGRIESNKGVFDLLEIAKHFVTIGRHDIVFDICGTGSAFEDLQKAIKLAGIDSNFVCHGHCNKSQMREMFNQAHTVIVPTKTDFVEGFNQVVVEGVLSGRPVVTSAVCPALSYVRDAVVEVPPDDIQEYSNALLKLCDDRSFYEEKRRNCLTLQEQFYDPSRGWGAMLKSVLATL